MHGSGVFVFLFFCIWLRWDLGRVQKRVEALKNEIYKAAMAVPWTEKQQSRVIKILDEYPAESGLCDRAAAKVLPIAREIDRLAVARRCDPRYGIYVSLKHKWFFHVSVRALDHYVDALSGPGGLIECDYMESCWEHPDALVWRDLADSELKQ